MSWPSLSVGTRPLQAIGSADEARKVVAELPHRRLVQVHHVPRLVVLDADALARLGGDVEVVEVVLGRDLGRQQQGQCGQRQ